MIGFYCGVALLLAGAAGFVLFPLLRPAASPAARQEGAVLTLALLVGTGALYALLGTPAGLRTAWSEPAALTPTEADQLLDRLAQELVAVPENPQGWRVLARAYTGQGKYVEAGHAYAQLLKLVEPDADLLVNYAEVQAFANGKKLAGEPARLLERAVALAPDHVEGLLLLGSARFEQGDDGAAITHWRAVLRLAPEDAEPARIARAGIADAQARSGRR